MIKVLITVSGGNVVRIDSNNRNVRFVIIDEDNASVGDSGINKYEPDTVTENNMYELYDESTPRDKEIRDELKRIKF